MCSNKSTDRTNKKILQKPKPKYTAKPKKETPPESKTTQDTTTHTARHNKSKQQTSNTICSNVRNYLSDPGPVTNYRDWDSDSDSDLDSDWDWGT